MATKQEFLDACAYLTSTGALVGTGALYINGDSQTVLDEGANNADITPDEATLTQALLDLANQLTDDQTQDNARTSIRDLQSIATNNAPFIASLISWCLNADLNADNTATRFTGLASALSSQPAGIQIGFKASLLAEYGIDIDVIGIGNLTLLHKQQIIRFARSFATSWATVLLS